MIKDNEKKGQCSIQQEQHKPEKRAVSCKTNKKRRNKNNAIEEWKWEDKEKPMAEKKCTLETEVLVDLDPGLVAFEIFQMITRMNELLEIILT